MCNPANEMASFDGIWFFHNTFELVTVYILPPMDCINHALAAWSNGIIVFWCIGALTSWWSISSKFIFVCGWVYEKHQTNVHRPNGLLSLIQYKMLWFYTFGYYSHLMLRIFVGDKYWLSISINCKFEAQSQQQAISVQYKNRKASSKSQVGTKCAWTYIMKQVNPFLCGRLMANLALDQSMN